MEESTFLVLFYIYLLSNMDKYDESFLKDFKKSVFFYFRDSLNVSDFCLRFSGSLLSLPSREYCFRRNFVEFVRENNSLLGYKSINFS